jgi:hypothetical protein
MPQHYASIYHSRPESTSSGKPRRPLTQIKARRLGLPRRRSCALQRRPRAIYNCGNLFKCMTEGEAGLRFAILLDLVVYLLPAVNAQDTPFAFHAYLGSAASLTGFVLVLNRCFSRTAAIAPQEIAGKPNYSLDPIKFAAVVSMVWGIAGYLVGRIVAFQLWASDLMACAAFDRSWRLRRRASSRGRESTFRRQLRSWQTGDAEFSTRMNLRSCKLGTVCRHVERVSALRRPQSNILGRLRNTYLNCS